MIIKIKFRNPGISKKKAPEPNFLVRISSGGVRVFHVKGWGPKSSVSPSKRRDTRLFGGISRDVAGISRRHLKSLRKKFVFNSRPLCPPKRFFWGVFSASFLLFSYIEGPNKTPPKKVI